MSKSQKPKPFVENTTAEVEKARVFSIRLFAWTTVGLLAGGVTYALGAGLTLVVTQAPLSSAWLLTPAAACLLAGMYMAQISQRPLQAWAKQTANVTSTGIMSSHGHGSQDAPLPQITVYKEKTPTGPMHLAS